MSIRHRFNVAILLGAAALLAIVGTKAPAQDNSTWPVDGRIVGPDGEKSKDVSGIACETMQGFPRRCLVIDDNLQAAQTVELQEGRIIAGNSIPLIDNQFDGQPLELDGEGIGFADGFYYVIGSHGHPRDKKRKLDPVRDANKIKARIAASSQIVRVKLGADDSVISMDRSTKLRDVIASQSVLLPFMDRRLENNGLTIEGIALRGGRLLAGFRGPALDNGHAAVLSVTIDGLFGAGAPNTELHLLRLGDGQGVRDLAAFDGGILVLAGPTADGRGRYSIHWWDGESERIRFLRDLADIVGDDPDRKPEALLALDQSPYGLRALIVRRGERGRPSRCEHAAAVIPPSDTVLK